MVDFGNLNIVRGLMILAAILAILLGIPDLRERVREFIHWLYDFLKPDLLERIFGPEADIEILDRGEYEDRLKTEMENASRSISHISIHAFTVDRPPEQKIFESDAIEQRVLFLNPVERGAPNTRNGIESLRSSPYDPDDLTTDEKFRKEFRHFCEEYTNGGWNNVEVRLYDTTPWFRGVIIDEQKAGFLITPSLYDGRKAAKFWTEDPTVVQRIIDIYDDIWNGERTIKDFETWYEEWSQ